MKLKGIKYRLHQIISDAVWFQIDFGDTADKLGQHVGHAFDIYMANHKLTADDDDYVQIANALNELGYNWYVFERPMPAPKPSASRSRRAPDRDWETM